MIPNTQTFVQPLSTGVNTVYSYPNKIDLPSDLVITAIDTSSNLYSFVFQTGSVFTNNALGITATVTGADVDTGCTVTLSAPLAAGWSLDIRSAIPETQTTSIKNQGQFLPDLHEEAFDRVTRQLQDLNRRAYLFGVHGPDIENIPWPAVPAPLLRANTNLGFDINGKLTIAQNLASGTLSRGNIIAFLGADPFVEQTPAEVNVGIVPNLTYGPGNMLRYGITPNNPALAAANGAILQQLVSASVPNGPTGQFFFPNTTGTDTYYFDLRFYRFRDGIHIDGQNCIINLTTGSPSAQPVFMAIRDFRFENATIQYTYNAGAVDLFRLGSRYNDGLGWPANPTAPNGILDQDTLLANGLPLQGNFILRNLRISYNNPNTACINQIGGLRNVTLENIFIDGAGTALGGIYCEYGFASLNGQPVTSSAWTSSHANNMRWNNIVVTNTGTGVSNFGVSANGAGDLSVENIYVNGTYNGMAFGGGEAFYFRMWAHDGQGGGGSLSIPRLIKVRNALILCTGTGIQLVGASNVGGAYIAPAINALATPQKWQAQTDYLNLDLDGFRIYSDSGVSFGGSQGHIRNGVIHGQGTATSGGIFLGTDAIHTEIEKVQVLNCNGPGIRANTSATIWTPKRPIFFRVADCFVAGNTAGIQVDFCQSAIIENNQIGYNPTYNVAAETTQTVGINVGLNCDASAVVCRNNFTSVPGGGVAYANIGGAQIIQGEQNAGYSTSGNWVQQTPTAASTGWGVPSGAVQVPNFPGATASLLQCSETIAYLITILKANGLMAT